MPAALAAHARRRHGAHAPRRHPGAAHARRALVGRRAARGEAPSRAPASASPSPAARASSSPRRTRAARGCGSRASTATSPLPRHLCRHGRPIRYSYVREQWPLADYQTAFALQPGSAEMPSAGRPFTPALITRLVARGVLVAPLVLHTGVSSPERHEPPYPERYAVPTATAQLVNHVHEHGGRVIAVGTTVVRALETAAAPDGTVSAADGWTGLVVTPERGLFAVDGLITGWHEPEASHLQLLEAAAGEPLLRAQLRRGAGDAAISGTSSATATSCCRERLTAARPPRVAGQRDVREGLEAHRAARRRAASGAVEPPVATKRRVLRGIAVDVHLQRLPRARAPASLRTGRSSPGSPARSRRGRPGGRRRCAPRSTPAAAGWAIDRDGPLVGIAAGHDARVDHGRAQVALRIEQVAAVAACCARRRGVLEDRLIQPPVEASPPCRSRARRAR